MKQQLTLGFVGQGWVGKHYADHFEERGFSVIRYGLQPEFRDARDMIATCDIVFIAVPTPTTPHGFSLDAVRDALGLVGIGKSAIIKSTIIAGSADALSEEFPDRFVFHSPEFLREKTARFDVDNPDRNIIGVPARHMDNDEWKRRVKSIADILPRAKMGTTENIICSAREAELVKYGSNNFLFTKTVFMNILYDLSQALGMDWEMIVRGMVSDPRIGSSHMYPVHQYEHMGTHAGRGAGGHCFPKDFSALRRLYEKTCPNDREGILILRLIEAKNNRLLVESGKDLDILRGIYGDKVFCVCDALGHAECTCGLSRLA